jgi:hypothetical protein
MGWMEDEQKLDRVEAALRASLRRSPFPELVGLPHLVQELRSWLIDDRQWRHARGGGWRSLVRDVEASLLAYPASVLAHAGGRSELRDELQQCDRELAQEDLRREEMLRRRLSHICDQLEVGLITPDARTAAWDDLVARNASQSQARASAARLFDLTAWAGLESEGLLQALEFYLGGQTQRPIAPARLRLARAAAQVARAPERAIITVWLRILFAPIHAGMLAVGSNVQIYQASALAGKFAHPDAATPTEVVNDDGSLRSLCRADELLNPSHPPVATHVETPWALARIEVPNATTQEAVGRARRTAAILGALGTLYGADPSLWRIDNSFVTFRAGSRSAASFAAPVADSASFTERVAVSRDPTAGLLRHTALRLGKHLPTTPGRMDEIAELMLWLREAHSSPPPSRLVLCDRAIETVSGWAGVATPRRFVEMHLIPSWSRRQMLGEIRAIAIEIFYNDQRRVFPAGDPRHDAWAEVVSDPTLRLRDIAEGDAAALKALIANVDTLLARLPRDHPDWDQVDQLGRHVASPRATLDWLKELTKRGMANEARRSRTRNALVHGGPLSGPTVDVVIAFAQYMADEALARTLEAFLDGEDTCTAFMKLGHHGDRLIRRLRAGDPVAEVLTWF